MDSKTIAKKHLYISMELDIRNALEPIFDKYRDQVECIEWAMLFNKFTTEMIMYDVKDLMRKEK